MRDEPARDDSAGDDAPVIAATIDLLTRSSARALIETWTIGQPRFRVDWLRGGHRRRATWALAAAAERELPWLVNDPRESPWELAIDDPPASSQRADITVELRPRGLAAPRFTYRRGDVPAASHPTLAAALARVAEARPDEIVWDPFVGSGLELIERGLLGTARRLIGSDIDPRALAVARRNVEAAKTTRVELLEGDATTLRPCREIDAIITNPPMGRRIRGDIGPLLTRFLGHAAALLRSGGHLTWLSPLPQRTRHVAIRLGLRLEVQLTVDMGGFNAELQRWRKP
jgi:hypothetical protein